MSVTETAGRQIGWNRYGLMSPAATDEPGAATTIRIIWPSTSHGERYRSEDEHGRMIAGDPHPDGPIEHQRTAGRALSVLARSSADSSEYF